MAKENAQVSDAIRRTTVEGNRLTAHCALEVPPRLSDHMPEPTEAHVDGVVEGVERKESAIGVA